MIALARKAEAEKQRQEGPPCMLGMGAQSGQDNAVARVFTYLEMGLVKLHIQCASPT